LARSGGLKICLSAIACLLLTACAGGARISHYDYGRYSRSIAYVAAPDGEMPLAVYGSPVPGNPAGLAQAVAHAMRGTHTDWRTVFVPANSPNLNGYRTVVVFGNSTPETVCSVKDATGLANSSPTRMTAAFCYGNEALSYVSGSVPVVDSINGRVLASHMRLVGYTLFPDENPHLRRDCHRIAPICKD